MSTVRLQIVDAIAAALATATGLTVYRNLDYALEDSNLPALVVASGEEQVSDRMIGKIDHQVMLDIAVLIAGSATPESAADPYEAQIHAALFGATSFGGFPLLMERVSAGWQFDLGDCCARGLRYQFTHTTSMTSLES